VPRYTEHWEPGKLTIVVPRVFDVVLFLVVPVFVVWSIYDLKHAALGTRIFFAVVISLFIVGWLWNLDGREVLEFTPAELTHRRVLFGFAHSKAYPAADIRATHFVAPKVGHRGRKSASGIGFIYHQKEIRFGDHLEREEARKIVCSVLAHFPELEPVWGAYYDAPPPKKGLVRLNLR
jgi:hypothetical protein